MLSATCCLPSLLAACWPRWSAPGSWPLSPTQWEIQNTSRLAADGERAAAWPVGIPAPSRPASRFEVLRWDYFTEQHAFSCADGSPRCPLRGADRADVADVLGAALEELNRRYHPALRLQKQQLVNGYRRFDPARGMEYTLDLQLEALTPQGGRRPLTRRVQLLRPLSRVEILPVPYVTEASRLTVLLPLAAAERDLAPAFLEAFATAALEPGDAAAALTLLLLYEPRQAQRAAHADVFAPVKAHVAELERRFPGARVPWLSVQTAAPSPLRLMDLLSKKHTHLWLISKDFPGTLSAFLACIADGFRVSWRWANPRGRLRSPS